MTIHSLFDPYDYQMGETSYVIKSTIVVLFLIFNLKGFADVFSIIKKRLVVLATGSYHSD